MGHEGATDCKHYGGVKSTKSRKCCGGKVIKRTSINCAVLGGIIYAEHQCRAEFCSKYIPKQPS